ncbi:MAG: hypothetical protein M3552_06415 [Planctomycetota bacterium]|nr:hypothetical protein [Planctomycetota bacterium]
MYALSAAEADTGRTGVLAVIGDGTVLWATRPTAPEKDTVALIEAKKAAPLWTMPKDIAKEELIELSRKGELGSLSHSGYKLAVLSLGPTSHPIGLSLDCGPEEIVASVTVQGR